MTVTCNLRKTIRKFSIGNDAGISYVNYAKILKPSLHPIKRGDISCGFLFHKFRWVQYFNDMFRIVTLLKPNLT